MTDAAETREQVLVIHDGELAGTVRMLAAARRIREHHRKARITLLCGPDFEGLLKHCPYFNAAEPLLEETGKKNFFARLKAARNSGFDVIYDLGGGAAAARVRSVVRFTRTRWVDLRPDPKSDAHPLDQVAARLGAAGMGQSAYRLGEAPPPDLDWIDFVAKRSRTLDPAYFGLQGRYALFAPAGDEFPPSQRWPKERWATLAHTLLEAEIEPVIVGGPSVRELGRYVAHVTPGARDLSGRANIIQLAGLGRRASCTFGEGIGLLHLLVAAGSPAILLHPGEEAPHASAPRGRSPTILMHAPTLAQINVPEALQAMRCAGGFSPADRAA